MGIDMFSGTVSITTRMTQPGVKFPPFEYNCGHPNVIKCEFATDDGHEIRATITLKSVPTAEGVEDTALKIFKQAIQRLECLYDMSRGEVRAEVRDLRSESNPSDCILVMRGAVGKAAGCKAAIIVRRSPDELRGVLERSSFLADIYFELFNQAKTSSNAVVEFLGYYQIISSILEDPPQAGIDSFILAHEPGAPQTQRPGKKPGVMETVYTRLRNEVAHVRCAPGTTNPKDISHTKTEIMDRVDGLRHLAAVAIKTIF